MSAAFPEKLRDELGKIGCELLTIEFSPEDNLRTEGWRSGIEKYGQELWCIYHWTVWAQHGSTHGIYRLRDWLEQFNIPDNTGGAHWVRDIQSAAVPAVGHGDQA